MINKSFAVEYFYFSFIYFMMDKANMGFAVKG